MAICKEIHIEFHNQYGRGYNTPEQFEEFCIKNYSITNFPWRQGNHNPSIGLLEEQESIVKFSNKKADEFAREVKARGHEIIYESKIYRRILHK